MTNSTDRSGRNRLSIHSALRVVFALWAVFAMSWLANSVRTRGVDERLLRGDGRVSVRSAATHLAFVPDSSARHTALVFLCGSGIAAEAYAPLLRPLAEQGFPVFIVRLPFRFAPLESHRQEALGRARGVIAAHPEVGHWVVAGHSLGAALAARMAQSDPESFSALVLVATTHPKRDDLSHLGIPVTKLYATNDGVAPPARVLATRALLPPGTKFVAIEGGNHSQFGRYGHQLFDGTATIGRERQEALTRAELLHALVAADGTTMPDDHAPR